MKEDFEKKLEKQEEKMKEDFEEKLEEQEEKMEEDFEEKMEEQEKRIDKKLEAEMEASHASQGKRFCVISRQPVNLWSTCKHKQWKALPYFSYPRVQK